MRACVRLLGPCDGIVCIVKDDRAILCNPPLQEFKYISLCPFACPQFHNEEITGVGLGFDNCKNDFKVVLIRTLIGDIDVGEPDNYEAIWLKTVVVHLYSTITNSWRHVEFNGTIMYPHVSYPYSEIFFNDACHWHASIVNDQSQKMIMCFDMNNEVFRQLEYPTECVMKQRKHLTVLDECLTMLQHEAVLDRKSFDIEIWVMKEYGIRSSWTKKFVVTTKTFVYPLSWKNDVLLLIEPYSHSDQLECVELHSNEIKKLPFHGSVNTFCTLVNEESLMSLNQVINF